MQSILMHLRSIKIRQHVHLPPFLSLSLKTGLNLICATYFSGPSYSLKNQVALTKPSEIKRDKSWKLRPGKGRRMRHHARIDNALPIDKSAHSRNRMSMWSHIQISTLCLYPPSSKILRCTLARAMSPVTECTFFLFPFRLFFHILQLYLDVPGARYFYRSKFNFHIKRLSARDNLISISKSSWNMLFYHADKIRIVIS